MSDRHGSSSGVIGILQYNWHFYVASFCTLVVLFATLRMQIVPPPWGMFVVGGMTLTAFWSLSSILISYYVYDYRAVTRWEWLPRALLFPPQKWLNVHAGLDESSLILRRFFPDTQSTVVDIFDDREMTEPSIARARLLHPSQTQAVQGKLDALPLPDRSCDSLFLLLAAHEIRQPERREKFFKECARVLSDSGQLLLVEHLRDWKNFVAFGPGFLHFHSKREWLRLAYKADLKVEREDQLTPFVRCFLFGKADR